MENNLDNDTTSKPERRKKIKYEPNGFSGEIGSWWREDSSRIQSNCEIVIVSRSGPPPPHPPLFETFLVLDTTPGALSPQCRSPATYAFSPERIHHSATVSNWIYGNVYYMSLPKTKRVVLSKCLLYRLALRFNFFKRPLSKLTCVSTKIVVGMG